MSRPDLEERCCAALTAVELEDYVGIDTFDQVLKSVMALVERELVEPLIAAEAMLPMGGPVFGVCAECERSAQLGPGVLNRAIAAEARAARLEGALRKWMIYAEACADGINARLDVLMDEAIKASCLDAALNGAGES